MSSRERKASVCSILAQHGPNWCKTAMWEQFSSPPLSALTWRGIAEEIRKGTAWFSASDKQYGNSCLPEVTKLHMKSAFPKRAKCNLKTLLLWRQVLPAFYRCRLYVEHQVALCVNKESFFKCQAQILREQEIFISCFRVQEQLKLPYR